MAHAVFTTRAGSIYDDLPEARYHFPSRYLKIARQAVGDWILYYEPRRDKGRQSYFAVARVDRIDPDPLRPDHFYAQMSGYLEFVVPVRFREPNGHYWESALRKSDGRLNAGAFQWALRLIPDREFDLIISAGFEGVIGQPLVTSQPGLHWRDYQFNKRAVRDASFARVVKDAYDQTCAFTGLRIRNGGGTSEVEAAHILPVAEHGPDSPRNGLALSRTVHWAFDRHLLSMGDDGRTLVSEQLPDEFRRLVRERVRLPADPRLRPHPQFLDRHRGLFRG
jgi:putative restriction endonuclease